MPKNLRLLSPTQVQQSKNSLLEREVLRTKEVQEASDKARKELALAQADFKQTMADNLDTWAKEEDEHQRLLKERERELAVLEERKRQALIPISIYEERAEKKMQAATAMQQYCDEHEEKLREREEILEDRLDEVAEQKKVLDAHQESLDKIEKGIQLQAQSTALNAQRLSEELRKFEVYSREQEAKIAKEKTELLLIQRSNRAVSEALEAKEQFIQEERVRLADMRATLERAMKRKG